MKKTNIILSALLAGGLCWTACEKALPDNNIPQTYPDNARTAFVKFIHAYAGKAPAMTSGAGPNIIFYINDTLNRLNGTALTYAASGGQYPTPSVAATNTRSFYIAAPVGRFQIYGMLARFTGSRPTPAAGDTVFRSILNFEAGKNYSLFLADSAQSPSMVLVPDNFGTISDGKYKIRLANFQAWPDDVQEIYSTREGKVVQDNITYKNVGQFIELNAPGRTDTFQVRKVSGSSPVGVGHVFYQVAFTPQSKRAYTVFTRGKMITGTSTVFQSIAPGLTTLY
jgi:hypothetical protein